MEQTFDFIINRKLLLNANVALHFHAKATRVKALREMACEMAKDIHKSFKHFTITIAVCPPTRRRLDPPNLYPTVKALVDGLTDAKLWEDDNWQYMKSMTFTYGGLSGLKDSYRLLFTIKEVENE